MCTVMENPKINLPKKDEPTFLNSIRESLLDELIDDVILELCFEVHRAAKLGYLELIDIGEYHTDKNTKNNSRQAQKKKEESFVICCPICKAKKSASNFAKHLDTCKGGGRNTKDTTKKILDALGSSSDDNEDDSDTDFNGRAKRSKKSQTKKSACGKRKIRANFISKPATHTIASFQEMTWEKRKAFFNELCGVISKRTNKLCMNTHKCAQHNDEERRNVRHGLLSNMSDQLTNDNHIDVDTIDETSDGLPLCSSYSVQHPF